MISLYLKNETITVFIHSVYAYFVHTFGLIFVYLKKNSKFSIIELLIQ